MKKEPGLPFRSEDSNPASFQKGSPHQLCCLPCTPSPPYSCQPMSLRAFAQATSIARTTLHSPCAMTFPVYLASIEHRSLKSYKAACNLLSCKKVASTFQSSPSTSVSPLQNHKNQKYLPTTRSPCFTPIFLIAAANKATCCLNSSNVTFTSSSLPSPGKRKGTDGTDSPKRQVLSHRQGGKLTQSKHTLETGARKHHIDTGLLNFLEKNVYVEVSLRGQHDQPRCRRNNT